jgi:hypothetical protein
VTVYEVAVDWRWIGLPPAAFRSLGASIVVTDDDGDGHGAGPEDGHRDRGSAGTDPRAEAGADADTGTRAPAGAGSSVGGGLPITAEIGGGIYPRKRPSEFAAIRLAAP